jgi:hypothetical protein
VEGHSHTFVGASVSYLFGGKGGDIRIYYLLELFLSAVRSRGGWNNNPSAVHLKAA